MNERQFSNGLDLYDRDMSYAAFKEWARRGFDPNDMPSREEIENPHDFNQWRRILSWINQRHDGEVHDGA